MSYQYEQTYPSIDKVLVPSIVSSFLVHRFISLSTSTQVTIIFVSFFTTKDHISGYLV
jgi:hypothetical protein